MRKGMDMYFSSMKHFVILCVLLGGVLGCSVETEENVSVATTPTLTPASPEQIPSLTSTQAPITPTSTLVPTRQPPSSTPSPSPTLSNTQRADILEQLNRKTLACQLRCWWGFEPGSSSVDELQAQFNDLRISVSTFEREDGIVIYSIVSLSSNKLLHAADFFDVEQDGVLDWIRVTVDSRQNRDALIGIWSPFAPDRVLSAYGVPDRVHIASMASIGDDPQPEKMPYWISFFYDDLGLQISYGGFVKNEATYHLCPTFSPNGNLGDTIQIYMQSPYYFSSLEKLEEKIIGVVIDNDLLLENITDLSTKELYQMYLSEKEVCFDIPRDTWR